MKLHFLTLDDVLEIHTDQISRYGGRIGIRDQNLLLSAISQPSGMFNGQYLHKSLYNKAAAYLFHICQNHPFIDGNKRVGLVSMLVFLDINKSPINYSGNELESLTRSVAESKMQKEEIADFLTKRLSQ